MHEPGCPAHPDDPQDACRVCYQVLGREYTELHDRYMRLLDEAAKTAGRPMRQRRTVTSPLSRPTAATGPQRFRRDSRRS